MPITEARCQKCGDTFVIVDHDEPVTHYQRADDETECNGPGVIVGSYQPPVRKRRT